MIFRNIVFSAVLVGLIAGVLYSAFQQWQVNPIIYAAEQYEVDQTTVEANPAVEEDDPSHRHDHEAWSPQDGWQRLLSAFIANSLIGIGFSLLLICAMSLHNLKSNKPQVNWKSGLLWGLAALAVVFIAPAIFGLPPEIPGTVAEGLGHRQSWWTLTAICTAIGLSILYYAPTLAKVAGLVFIAVPHIIGAPKPDMHTYLNTEPSAVVALDALTHRFIMVSSIGMALFCLLLGALSGYAASRLCIQLDG